MKKTLSAVALLLLIVVVGAPFYGSMKTQETLDHLVAYLDSSPTYQAQWSTYDKSWLSTDATLLVTLQGMPSKEPVVLPLTLHLNHGPLLIRDGLQLAWFSGHVRLAEEVEGWLQERLTLSEPGPLWETQLKMELDGDLHFSDRSQKFALQLDEALVAVEEYRGAGIYSRGGLLNYRGTFPSVSLAGEGAELLIEQIELVTELDFSARQGNYFMPGSGQFSIKSMKGGGPGQESISLTNLALSSDAKLREEEALADIGFNVGLESLEFLGETVTDAALKTSLQRISLAFLKRYTETAEAMTVTADVDVAIMGLQLMQPIMEDLLPHSPRIVISPLAFTTPEGSLTFELDLNVDATGVNVSNPMELLQHLKIEAQLMVDKALAMRLVEQSTRKELLERQFEKGGDVMTDAELDKAAKSQAQFKLNLLVIQKMLVQEEDEYRAALLFENGKATLNGQVLPLPF